uniref:Uncharacterized protein n=1 Tax=Anguilla anguilla TaxID=7936 RepID=A0A0E9W3F6_ANGAN
MGLKKCKLPFNTRDSCPQTAAYPDWVPCPADIIWIFAHRWFAYLWL